MNCGRVFSQQFLITYMHTELKQGKLVSNRTDSSALVDERQIKESRGGSQRSLPLPDLSRKIEGPLLAGYSFRRLDQLICLFSFDLIHLYDF